ncbi:MFS transporter, partial [Salmonella enterica subsp. enterica serovar Virchow]|nr:MFS transporter [Salmonella enterica subsp. enterica serovar Virchow]
LILGALAISGTMLALFLFGSSAWAAAVFVALWGLAFGLVPVGFQAWAVKTTPDDMESIGGLLVAAFQVAITAGAAIGGVFVDGFGPAGAIGYAVFGSLVGALIFVVFRGNDQTS